MAEVKQVSGSFSLSSPKKKPPTFSNNGVSSSFKHVYDDVFASSPSRKLKPSISFMEDDYAEVFGSSKSNNGSWSIPYSSIPIIDLPKENGLCNRGETVDYGGVFGGIDADSFGLPDGEELFDQLKKKPKTSSTYTLPRSQGQTMEAVSPGISNQSYGQLPTNGFCQSFDNTKHFDSGNTELATNATRRPRKSAHVRANSSHEVSATPKMLSSRTLVTRDDGQSQKNVFDQSSDDMKRFEPGKNEITVNGTSMPRKASHVRAYSSHDASVTQKTLSTETPVTKDDRQSPTNGFCQSSDNVKHFEPDNDGMIVNATSRPEKSAAHVRAYSLHESGTTQKILLSEAPVMIDDALVADSNFGRKQGKHSKHTSLDLSANNPNNNGDAVLQNLSGMSGSNLVDSSPGTCQPSDAEMNELSQSSDNTLPSKFEANEMSFNMASGATQAAGIHTSHESNDELHKLSPTQKTLSSRTHVLNEVTSSGIDIVVEEQRKHSYNTSSDPGTSGQNGVFEAGFQKASGLHESTSIDTSDGACQASFEAGPSKVVKDAGIADGCDKVKKKGRRSRMSSLDLNDSKHSCELEGGLQRKPRFGSSYSFDASHDPCAAHVKVQPSKMYPSSSLPQYFPVESHYKISENPSCKNSQKNMYRDGVGSPPSLADELDVNSAAAVSAATLQRAIEEAEIRIRLAKEFLERERQGSTNLRFKDTLKVKVAKGIKKFEQSKIDESFPPVDSEMQSFSPLERKHITKNAEVAAGFEDQNNFFKDEEFTETKDADMSELVRGEDKCEGGEWEAAKHLNQIISGVKNRIASFMSWQTDTEKKEDPKGFETNIHQQQPEEVEHDLKDHEVFYNRTGENQGATIQGEAMRGVNVVKSPEASVLEENGRARGFTAKPEKVGNKVDITCNPVEPSLANFQFFAFRNQKLFEPLDSEVEEKKGHQDCREPDTENEPVINEVKDESLPFQGEEASPEELKGKFVAQDSMMQGDVYIPSDTGSSYDKAVEEHSSLPAHDELELSHEAGRQGDMSRNGDVCSTNDKIAEMVEDLFSMAVHDTKEHNYEEDRQDVMSRKSHIGYTNEENVEIVEKLCSLSGYDGNLFADEEERKDDMCKKSHLSSSCKEHDKIVEEIYTQTEHERTNVVHEEYNDECLNEERVEESLEHSDYYDSTTEKTDMDGEFEEPKEAVNQHENEDVIEEMNPEAETWETLEATEGEFGCQENERDEMNTSHIEEASAQSYGWEEVKTFQIDCLEETEENVTMQASCAVSVEEGFEQNESLLSKGEEACRFVESSSKIEDEVYPDEEIERMVDITNTSSESEMDIDSSKSAEKIAELITEEPVLSPSSTESIMEVDRNELKEGAKENFISLDDETDMLSVEKDDVKIVEPQSQDNLENETDYWHESQENLHVEEFDADIDQEMEMAGIEAVHRRRRWFDHRGSIATAQRPSILEVNQTDLEIDQEVLDETELAGSVEIHAGNLDSGAEVASIRESEVPLNQDNNRTNVDTTPKRRRWFVKKGEEGVPEPLSLFEGVKVNLEVPLESTDEALMHKSNISGKCLDPLSTKIGDSLDGVKSDVEINGEKGQQSGEAAPRRKRWFESQERVGPNQQVRINGDVGLTVETDQESNAKGDAEAQGKHCSIPIPQEKDGINNKLESKEHGSDMNEANRRGKEKEKEKLAVERAIREARERAFAEARDRAKKDAAERPNTEARQRVAVGAQEKLGKVSSEGTSSSDKASVEAKLKAERAAVERATAEARERALQKALSEKSFHRSREQGGKYSTERSSSNIEPKYTSSRCSDASNSSEKSEGVDIESTQRRKARLERQKRTTERAAKALDEKNKRDIVAQKEQAAKNMLADALDAEVRRWSTGKEGNLRALLSTLQYILGPDSGWQPVSLTDLVAATAVRKAYKKATLCVHPDKLQQRGASIQQKHICEKVFDLLKEAWNKFNPDDR